MVRGIIVDDVRLSSPPFWGSDILYLTGTENQNGGHVNPLEAVVIDFFAETGTNPSRYTDKIEAFRLTLTGDLDWTGTDAELDLASFEADFRACVAEKCRPDILSRVDQGSPNNPQRTTPGRAARFIQAVRKFGHNRRLFIARSGYYGFGPLS
jgi:hypothetical protein